ncbi:hypothetical protein [Metallosphaera turreted icosahedral virus 3]|nr:hypothetical protein [Metallosphaera turreted icosahedral virus 3]WHA35151.1 hypothetical protein MTIV3_ORF9 [Metallosphaera turreted icosahedral virus 3]
MNSDLFILRDPATESKTSRVSRSILNVITIRVMLLPQYRQFLNRRGYYDYFAVRRIHDNRVIHVGDGTLVTVVVRSYLNAGTFLNYPLKRLYPHC